MTTNATDFLVDADARRTVFSHPGAKSAPALVPNEAWVQELLPEPALRRPQVHLSGYLTYRSPTLVACLAALAHCEHTHVSSTTVSLDTAPLAGGTHQRARVVHVWRMRYATDTTVAVRNGAHRTSSVDTTGADAAFVAGFLAAWSPGREHPTAALTAGAEVAALAVDHIGAGPPPPEGR